MKKIMMTAGILAGITSTINTNPAFADSVNSTTSGKVSVDSNTVLNLRKGPSTNSKVLAKMKSGTSIKILKSADSNWYKVSYKGTEGYASKKYIAVTNSSKTSSSSSSKGKVNTTSARLNVRKSPTVNSSKIGQLSPGQSVEILEKTNGWYKIKYNNTTGYVSAEYISVVNSNESQSSSNSQSKVGKIATVNVDVLNIRSGAGTKYSVINKVYEGNNVKILSQNSNGWVKVELVSGSTGWCNGKYLNNFRNGTLASVSTQETTSSSSSTSQNKKVQEVINIAKSKLGCKYVWGAEGPNTFDCSGLTSYVYKKGAGIVIPRTSKAQSQSGKYVSKSDLKPGDLVFFDGNYGNNVNHVGIYIGNNEMIHAPKPGDVVKIQKIDITHYKKAYVTARRFI